MKNKEDNILIKSVLDKYKKYKKSGLSTCSNFLNTRELKLVISQLNKEKIQYNIYPSLDYLEKKIIYFGDYKDFITFYKADISDDITHKDILGTLF